MTGFSNSAAGTVIPNAFFATTLPHITDPAELVVSTYLFFAVTQKRRNPRFITLRELEADPVLTRSLINLAPGDDLLTRGLQLAVTRGTLVRATSNDDTLYSVNIPSNVRALERLADPGVQIEAPLPAGDRDHATNIFSLYEATIGSITPLIVDDLREAEAQWPAEWIQDAFREAAELNKRSWRYVRTILQRWETEGRHEEHRRDPEADWLARRYRAGKRPPASSPR